MYGGYTDTLILLKGNNQAYFIIVRNFEYYRYIKAINIYYYHVRDLITKDIVILDYIPTKHILIDSLMNCYRLLGNYRQPIGYT
jgi:hypothetical protein